MSRASFGATREAGAGTAGAAGVTASAGAECASFGAGESLAGVSAMQHGAVVRGAGFDPAGAAWCGQPEWAAPEDAMSQHDFGVPPAASAPTRQKLVPAKNSAAAKSAGRRPMQRVCFIVRSIGR